MWNAKCGKCIASDQLVAYRQWIENLTAKRPHNGTTFFLNLETTCTAKRVRKLLLNCCYLLFLILALQKGYARGGLLGALPWINSSIRWSRKLQEAGINGRNEPDIGLGIGEHSSGAEHFEKRPRPARERNNRGRRSSVGKFVVIQAEVHASQEQAGEAEVLNLSFLSYITQDRSVVFVCPFFCIHMVFSRRTDWTKRGGMVSVNPAAVLSENIPILLVVP